MSTKLAPNKQAEQSLDLQTIEVPGDLRVSTITSPAIVFLSRLESGDPISELNDKLREVAGACYNLTKKGKITIELDFKPSGARKMDIRASIKTKVPQEERAPSTQFVTPDGQLLAHDPDQQRFDLKVIKTHDVSARVIDVEEAAPARKIA